MIFFYEKSKKIKYKTKDNKKKKNRARDVLQNRRAQRNGEKGERAGWGRDEKNYDVSYTCVPQVPR